VQAAVLWVTFSQTQLISVKLGLYPGPAQLQGTIMQITTERLLIRSFTEQDLPAYTAMHADAEVMRYLGGPISAHNAAQQLQDILAADRTTGIARYAVELQQQPGLIGFCGFKPAGDFVDLGYQYSKAVWGTGIGLEAALAVRHFGLQSLAITNMEAGGAVANHASIRILAKLQFTHQQALEFNGVPSVRFYDLL